MNGVLVFCVLLLGVVTGRLILRVPLAQQILLVVLDLVTVFGVAEFEAEMERRLS